MSITLNPRLYVSLSPLDHVKPHPINDGRFDPAYAYKVLGVYNASETSECFFILSNTHGEMWFISQRHLRTYKLLDSDEFFVELEAQQRNVANESATVARVLPIAGNGTH
ncbi:hypothetical protein H9Q13_12795 [Pontibacter sp. JH31]|uniref:Uncharacterized protein n=1 Tax=Pontibacter aquaedesilientis TaxID=2766980 RepID=A0ABR7XIH2_9BACT|nr:hypothetical protein [Pontibacter aquaedesilientis]MBD1398048.1 hypothetical protein [Pontibacter aquaedesilientis]